MMMSHELHQERLQVGKLDERAILVACELPNAPVELQDTLGELRELTKTAGATIVGEMIQKRQKPVGSTYLGKGKLEELNILKDELQATLVIFDNDLTPSQVRNIEKIVECKIIDRSELILDIFAGRATTTAARIQVELAQLEYTYPRLKSMWSHLGQITGGAPVGIGTRGPGETQIETDRRLVQRRKNVLRKRIDEIANRRVREVAQRTSENFTVCLVGYTNAGKSTLFNAITEPSGGGGAYADDRLFATLTTRTRRWPLEDSSAKSNSSGDEALLSDTVGFVRDLPHHLVASFRATLEEAIHADVLLLIIDVSDPMAKHHYEVVCTTLDALEADYESQVRRTGRGPIERKIQFAPDVEASQKNWGESGLEPTPPHISAAESQEDVEGFDRMSVQPNDADDAKLKVRHPVRLLILNKIDLLEDQTELAYWHALVRDALPVSAVTGDGLDALRERIHLLFSGGVEEYLVTLPYSEAKVLTYVEQRGEVLDRQYDATNVILRVRLGAIHANQLGTMGATVDRALHELP